MRIFFILGLSLLFAQESDTTTAADDTIKVKADTTRYPTIHLEKEKTEKLPEGEPFFDYKDDLDDLQIQIDSLKKVIRVLERKKAIPTINEELLNLIKIPELQHRVELRNGTVVMGEILEETASEVIIQTTIGQLSIEKDKVVNIAEETPPAPKVEFMSEPFISVYPDREEITGMVKNSGKTRADFVRIVANLWTADTELVKRDSAFASGSIQEYMSGVSTDTALEPGATGSFTINIPITENDPTVGYRTFQIRWIEAD